MTLSIPKIADEHLEELYRRIKPVVRMARVTWVTNKHEDGSATVTIKLDPKGKWSPDERGELCYIEDVDLRAVAFTWDPKRATRAKGLEKLAEIRTLHTYGYHGFFKPSIAEVLAQIPEEHLDDAVAFEVDGPDDADDLNAEPEALNAGFHVASTTLYRKKR